MKSESPHHLSESAFETLHRALREIVCPVAREQADDVDNQARFPAETFAALRQVGALSACVPTSLGGAGCSLTQLGTLCATLAAACGASGMILAMHFIQVACLVRHGADSPSLRAYIGKVVSDQLLLASMTSEVGTFGETRTSVCAIETEANGGFTLAKDATTGSYNAQADAILVTCRRTAESPGNDQLLVLVHRQDITLTQTTDWDTLGMRGTCSPGFRLAARGRLDQVLPAPFADISSLTMAPYSHLLWSALWSGIAADALGRASAMVRGQARGKPGQVPPAALRLAPVSTELQALQYHWKSVAAEFDALAATPAGEKQLLGIDWALKLNHLKISASEAAPRIVHGALQILGITGYKNGGPSSVGRHYRDVLSGALMVSNARIAAQSAGMLTVFKDM